MRKECVEREHVCQHCNFKATYEEVVDTHLPECMYIPLQCPNLCGVTCEREVMEDHMNDGDGIVLLQGKFQCQFTK